MLEFTTNIMFNIENNQVLLILLRGLLSSLAKNKWFLD